MATGRLESEWAQTSSLIAIVINANPYRKSKRPITPAEVNPMIEKGKRQQAGAQTVDLAKFKRKFLSKS